MKNFLVATAIGTMLTAGVAIAMQTETAIPTPAPVTKAQMLARADARFDQLDTNKDGQLSAAERQAGREAARKAAAERRGGEMGDFMPGAGRRGGMGDHMLGRIDTNGDGMISKTENRAALEARFARIDANGNGTIDAGERRGPGKSWGKRGDGKRMGMHRRGPGGGMISADTDKDGAISKAEFDAANAQRFARLDTNKDGKIDAAERRAGRPHRGTMPPPSPATPKGE